MTFTTQLLLFRGTILNLALRLLPSFVLGIGYIRSSQISRGQTRLFVPHFRTNSEQEHRTELKFESTFKSLPHQIIRFPHASPRISQTGKTRAQRETKFKFSLEYIMVHLTASRDPLSPQSPRTNPSHGKKPFSGEVIPVVKLQFFSLPVLSPSSRGSPACLWFTRGAREGGCLKTQLRRHRKGFVQDCWTARKADALKLPVMEQLG